MGLFWALVILTDVFLILVGLYGMILATGEDLS